jgi:hypothetical protein
MNQNFKKVLDLISEMKESFSKKEKEEMKFDQATLTDGTVIEYEALEVGQAVFVVADGESIPAPEGTHSLSGELEGVSIIVDASGVITEVVDERESIEEEASAETETETTEETMEAETVAESMSAEDVENIVSAKLESFSAIVDGLAEMTKTIAENNETLVNELSSLKSEFETFKAQPSVDEREGERFSKVGNLTTRQQFLLKNKKK